MDTYLNILLKDNMETLELETMEKISVKIVPGQYEGGQTGASEFVEASCREEAVKLFSESKERMQDINNWEHICSGESAGFCLTDKKGNEINTIPEIGNLIRIDLPGPGSKKGDGYDWVRIEEIEEQINDESDEELFAFRVRPTNNPMLPSGPIAHMFKAYATSSFILYRSENIVRMSQEGRNEIPNTDVTGVTDKIRNAVVSLFATLGLSIPQWKKLVRGILAIK